MKRETLEAAREVGDQESMLDRYVESVPGVSGKVALEDVLVVIR